MYMTYTISQDNTTGAETCNRERLCAVKNREVVLKAKAKRTRGAPVQSDFPPVLLGINGDSRNGRVPSPHNPRADLNGTQPSPAPSRYATLSPIPGPRPGIHFTRDRGTNICSDRAQDGDSP
ncbi:hypothetical protein K469DRAFT_211695 [Zopfia rhizophila CBS 207.26]|uniref:Uncharacterized protein n=1 Tax=Zopfia rhizophila CBS 207.26 TaxID=1314779 RepID=A0A6A6DZP7_9PEZI|nr:hypothetical protein K469DRAFT_211695 [Zopfia rhizophila CBS 207.26]